MFSWNILGFPAFWTPIWQATTFKSLGKLLTDFVSKYEDYPAIHASDDRVTKIYNSIWRRVVAINIFILPIIVCSAVNIVHIMYVEYLTTEVACVLVATMSLQWYLYFMPPSSSGGNYSNCNQLPLKICQLFSLQQ